MMFTIDNIKIELGKENNGVRLTTDNDDRVILPNQTIAFVKNIVKENFQIVKTYYNAEPGVSVSIDKRDLSIVSLKIVLDYLYMYNMWRNIYDHHKGRNLKFLIEDFEMPTTKDKIIWYFKNKYPDDYPAKCELMLGMSADEFKKYEKRRQEFYNMW